MNNKNTLPKDFLLINSFKNKENKVIYNVLHYKSGNIILTKSFSREFSINIVNFFAIVKALMYCKSHKVKLPIFSNNYSALKWIKDKKIKDYENTMVANCANMAVSILYRCENLDLVYYWNKQYFGTVGEFFRNS